MPEQEFDINNRTVETVGGEIHAKGGNTRTDSTPHPNSVSHPDNKQKASQVRMVVEYFYDVPHEELKRLSEDLGQNFTHALDYLRYLKQDLDAGGMEIDDLVGVKYFTGVRVEVAK